MNNILRFFNEDDNIYMNYLDKVNNKYEIVKSLSSKLKLDNNSKIMCIGCGTGDVDLKIIENTNKNVFVVGVDPSTKMLEMFKENAEKININFKIINEKFENINYEDKLDVILAINSIYFLDGWKNENNGNPLFKIFNILNENGTCIISIKNEESPHCKLKKIVGGGSSTGKVLRNILTNLQIPYISENVNSYIDITNCINNKEEMDKLLTFILSDKWNSCDEKIKEKIIKEINKFSIKRNGKILLPTKYENIWIRKLPMKPEIKEENDVLDIVNDADKIIENETREITHKKGLLHRESVVLLFNENNEIVLAKRRYDKKYDFSVSCHLKKGETYEDAAIRELKEELSLDVSREELIPITKIRHCSKNPQKINDKFIKIFAVKKFIEPQKIIFDTNEIIGLESFNLKELFKNENKSQALEYILNNEKIREFLRQINKYFEIKKEIKERVRTFIDFPIPGIIFKDTTQLLRDGKFFNKLINYISEYYRFSNIKYVASKDMQGMLWAGAIAHKLKAGIIPLFRKDLPGDCYKRIFAHEYNPSRVILLQKEAIKRGDRVLVVDYMIATGETMRNMVDLIEIAGGKVAGIFSLLELTTKNGRIGLEKYDVHTLVQY
ncbi:MAG: NUDIX domain-containing protein [Candidatus Aenigmatarchaeota archaeon]